ncbi:toprim domain-containing protein [Mycoplasma corogypsi]|uniref:toprim domain-containing protein n=1 Tax=Mycoplasma corogypsi TaxID=2106 RepID=UPI003872C328
MFDLPTISEFIERIKKIPGISKKQAEKIVLWILASEELDVNVLANLFKRIKTQISFCEICGFSIENGKCSICHNDERDNVLLVVENLAALQKIENGGYYFGKYFIFNTLIKNDIDLKKAENNLSKLEKYAKSFDEIILAISPTLEGEMTNNIIKSRLSYLNLKVSSLAIGIPIGAQVDYIDDITLKMSLSNRKK